MEIMNDDHKEATIMFDSLKKYQEEKRVLLIRDQKIQITKIKDPMHIEITLLETSEIYKTYYSFLDALYKKVNSTDPALSNLNLVMQELQKKTPSLFYNVGITCIVDLKFFFKYPLTVTAVNINLQEI